MTDPRRITAFLLLCLACVMPVQGQDRITVGSKNFNEGYLLGEIVAQMLELEGFAVERKFGLGGTLVCYEALLNGAIDVYVEYTGTLAEAILKLEGPAPDLDGLNAAVSDKGLQVLDSLGFNNTYALAMRKDTAEAEGISRISDLANHPELKPAFSLEFLNREGRLARSGGDLQPRRKACRD